MKRIIQLFSYLTFTFCTIGQTNTFPSNGNVGIGTLTPGALLDLGSAGTTLGVVRLAGSSSGNVSLQPNANAGSGVVLTLPSTSGTLVTGSGTINYLPKWTGVNTQGNSLFQDDGTQAGIGTTPNANSKLTVGNYATNGVSVFAYNEGDNGISFGGYNYNGNGGSGVVGYSYTYAVGTGTAYGVQGLATNITSRSGTNIGGYFTASGTGTNNYALITGTGNVGIGTSTPNAALDVNGMTYSRELYVGTPDANTITYMGSNNLLAVNGTAVFVKAKVAVYGSTWPDYVFSQNYKLTPLDSLEQFIQLNKHLPEMPTADDVKKNGIDLGDNQTLLLKKIEELTLIVIEQNKRIEKLELLRNKEK